MISRHRISLEELVSLPTFQFATLSWAKDRVAFYWDRTGRFELYVMDLRTGAIRQVSQGEVPRQPQARFVWRRDDAAIIFARDRDGNERNDLFRLELETGAVRQLTESPDTQEFAGEAHPDNRRLAVMSSRAGQLAVFTLDMKSLEWRQLTHFSAPAAPGRWSRDGEWLACTSNESPNLKNRDAYLVRHDGSDLRKVLSVREGSQDAIVDWHPDGRHVSVNSDASGVQRPGILDLETGALRWFGLEGMEEYGGSFSPDGSWMLTLRNQDASLLPVLYRVDTGEERHLRLPPGTASGGSFVLAGARLMLAHTTAERRPELLLYDLETESCEVLLPAEYGTIDPDVFVPDEYVSYPSYDGRRVPAILYTPRRVAPGAKLPALINVHGGPTSQFFRGFDGFAQFLTDLGYVVLEPNVRGSTGYGNEWRDLNLGDWGGGDLEDLAAGARFLQELPFVDPQRIGIFGVSYGGYLSCLAAVKKPDLFKAAGTMVGITDLHLLYEEGTTQFKYFLRQQMGDPEENRDLWRDRSAITHAHNLQAKLLILHGANDPRCPVSQARSFRSRLLELGKREGADFDYHEFADEGHGPGGNIAGKLRMAPLLVDFFLRQL